MNQEKDIKKNFNILKTPPHQVGFFVLYGIYYYGSYN